jgi:GntR family transcriptional regulator/MocR family aminotransferase
MLTPGEMPWDVFPLDGWTSLHRRIAVQLGAEALRAGDPAGWPKLKCELARRLTVTLDRDVAAAEILVLPSRQTALRLVARALLVPESQAWVESPGDPVHRAAILAAAGTPVGMRTDAAGIQLAPVRDAGQDARFAIVSAGASMPIGARLGRARRAALHHWAGEVDGWFVEDDLGGNLLLDPAIGAVGSHPRSVLVGSFGKLAAPGIGLAYVVAAPQMAERLLAEAALSGWETSILHQAVLHGFFTCGALDAHVERLRREAVARCDAFRRGITRYLEPGHAMHVSALSFAATIEFDDGATERALLKRCRGAGFAARGLSDFSDPALPRFGLVVGLAGASPVRLETEAARLGLLLRARPAAARAARGAAVAAE